MENEKWGTYEAAKKALDAFDKTHEGTKQSLISLGDILKSGGWGAVKFAVAIEAGDSMQYVPDDCPETNQAFIRSLNIVEGIILQRSVLVKQLEAAFHELPASLRETLCSGRREAKSRTERRQ